MGTTGKIEPPPLKKNEKKKEDQGKKKSVKTELPRRASSSTSHLHDAEDRWLRAADFEMQMQTRMQTCRLRPQTAEQTRPDLSLYTVYAQRGCAANQVVEERIAAG